MIPIYPGPCLPGCALPGQELPGSSVRLSAHLLGATVALLPRPLIRGRKPALRWRVTPQIPSLPMQLAEAWLAGPSRQRFLAV